MVRGNPLAPFAIAAAVVICAAPVRAEPESKAACRSAYEQGQRHQRKGALLEARKQFLVCSRDPCPQVMHADCTKWLGEVEALTPSIVVRAQSDHEDIVDARILFDGVVAAERLDGMPIYVDPGQHTIRVEWKGRTEERKVVVAVGQTGRPVDVVFARDEVPAPRVVARTERRPVPWTVYATAGISALALGGFAFFGIDANRRMNDLDASGCKPFCNRSDLDAVDRSALVADVSLGIGLVAAGAALALYLLRPTER